MQVAPCWASPVPLPASSTRSVACRARGSESTDVAFNREMVCFSCIKSSCCLPREACPRSRARIYKYQRAPGCACCPSRSVPTPGALPAARGLAGSWQEPAGSWRQRAVPAPAVEGVSARQDHSVAGSQRGRITVWPWAAPLAQELVAVGMEKQPSPCLGPCPWG